MTNTFPPAFPLANQLEANKSDAFQTVSESKRIIIRNAQDAYYQAALEGDAKALTSASDVLTDIYEQAGLNTADQDMISIVDAASKQLTGPAGMAMAGLQDGKSPRGRRGPVISRG